MLQAFVFRSSNVFLRSGRGRNTLSPLVSPLRRTFSTPVRNSPAISAALHQDQYSTAKGCRFDSKDKVSYAKKDVSDFSGGALQEDTIFALSSGAGVTAGVAIIRVSGPDARTCLGKLIQVKDPTTPSFPRPRYASVRKLYDPDDGELLDEALVLFFPGPRSFTGEDVVELHIHGSRAVISGVVEAMGRMQESGGRVVRPAERGEFTRRAFENGRLDLTGVEGLADLISAETAMQRKQALQQLGGRVRDMLEAWREEIKTCLAHAEAVIDFGDDVDEAAFEDIIPRIRRLHKEIEGHLNDGHRGEIVRGGARVVIVGEPNAGKSTLLNALARRPAAIVSPQAGTTRDIVEVQLDLNGIAVILSDTAGLRDKSDDPIEIEGMRRTRTAASVADITVFVHDASKGNLRDAIDKLPVRLRGDEDGESNGLVEVIGNERLVCVLNKIDLITAPDETSADQGLPVFETCLTESEGVSELVEHLEAIIRRRVEGVSSGDPGEQRNRNGEYVPVITRERHRFHMQNALASLRSFLEGRAGSDRSIFLPMDMAAEDLRIAGKELGSITGIIHVEEVLDVIFSEFCIGK